MTRYIVLSILGGMILGCRDADTRPVKFEVTCSSPIRVDTVINGRLSTTKENIVFYGIGNMIAVYPKSCIARQIR